MGSQPKKSTSKSVRKIRSARQRLELRMSLGELLGSSGSEILLIKNVRKEIAVLAIDLH